MKRTVTMMLILCLFAFTAYGQYWGGWTGGLGTADADTLPAYGQGMAVDGAGKIWYTSYYSSETVMVDTGSGTADDAQNVRAIYVFNPDGTPASFSPITELSVDGVNDTLWNSNRGLRTDHNGDIIRTTPTKLYNSNDHFMTSYYRNRNYKSHFQSCQPCSNESSDSDTECV